MQIHNPIKTDIVSTFPAKGGDFYIEIACGVEVRITRSEAKHLHERSRWNNATTLTKQGDGAYLFQINGATQ